MQLLKLTLTNFRSHAETTLEFPVLGSPVLIKGWNKDTGETTDASNGAGKTSIFDAIDYVLFHNKRNHLRHGAMAGKVTLEFEHNGVKYAIEKAFTDSDYNVKLLKNGITVSENKTEVEAMVRDVIGLNRKLYEQTIYQSQGFSQFFTSLTPSIKSQYILELLDISKWEHYHDVIKAQVNSLTDYTNKLEAKKAFIDEQLKSSYETVTRLDDPELHKTLKFKQDVLDGKRQMLNSLQQFESLKAQKVQLEGRKAQLLGQLKTTKSLYDSLQDDYAKYIKIQSDLETKQVLAVDENHKSTMFNLALSLEKQLAAREQEAITRRNDLEAWNKKAAVMLSQTMCPFCRRSMDPSCKAELEVYIVGERNTIEQDLINLKGTYANLMETRKSTAKQIEELNKQVAVYSEHITSLADVGGKIKLTTEKMAIYVQQLQDYSADLAKTEINLRDIIIPPEDPIQISALKAEILDLETRVKEIEAIFTQIKTLKDQTLRLHTESANLAVIITRHLEKLGLLRHIQTVFSINGIQKWLFINSLSKISAIANSLLQPVNLMVDFKLEKPKKKGDGFKPAFDINIRKVDGNSYLLEDLSGGERALINFAIRLAFSTIVATTHKFRFMIIDEGFGDMDAHNREYVATIIKQLATQFQIFLVTHFGDFENEFSNILVVEKENGVSRVLDKV